MSDDDSFASADELVIGGSQAPRSRRRWWIGGLALCVAGAGAGAAAWAAVSFFDKGAQPADALPDSTLGYVSLDLDPSGGQKIEALKLARKFPGFKDKVGLGTGDDVRKWVFGQLAEDSGCKVDFEKDVAPWLGSRLAMAAVGHDKPFPVVVVQTSDAEQADAGLEKLTACDTDEHYAWRTSGDWTVVAQTRAQVDQVVAGAEKGSLADDDDFRRWTDKAGDDGIMTAYAAPAAGGLLARELASSLADLTGSASAASGCADATDRVTGSLAQFKGAAASLRLRDGGIELSAVSDARVQSLTGTPSTSAKPAGTPAVATLPADTAVAYGLALPADWATTWKKQLTAKCGGDADEILGQLTDSLGFDLLADGPQVLGTSLAFALGPDVDVEALVNAGDPSALPVALKTTGEKDAVDRLLGSLTKSLGLPKGYLETRGGAGAVALALDGDYAEKVAGDGGLGKDPVFRDVVPHADDSSGVLYVNFDRLDHAISQLASGDEEVVDNVKPLRAVGASVWSDGDESHALLRVSLD